MYLNHGGATNRSLEVSEGVPFAAAAHDPHANEPQRQANRRRIADVKPEEGYHWADMMTPREHGVSGTVDAVPMARKEVVQKAAL